MLWCGVVRYDVVCNGIVLYSMACYDVVWYTSVCSVYDMV